MKFCRLSPFAIVQSEQLERLRNTGQVKAIVWVQHVKAVMVGGTMLSFILSTQEGHDLTSSSSDGAGHSASCRVSRSERRLWE